MFSSTNLGGLDYCYYCKKGYMSSSQILGGVRVLRPLTCVFDTFYKIKQEIIIFMGFRVLKMTCNWVLAIQTQTQLAWN